MNASKHVSRDASLTYGLCIAGALLEGYDLQAAGFAAPRYGPEFGLAPAQLGWTFTANTIGLLFGAMLGGWLADRIGRRAVLIASMVAMGVFSIGSAWAGDAQMLIAMRFLTGLGLGAAMPNLIAVISETGSGARVATKVAVMTAAIPAGGALGGIVLFLTDMGWRTVFALGGWLPLLLALVMLWKLPESQQFRLVRDARLNGASTAVQRQPVLQVLFGEGRAATTLLLWTCMLGTLTALYLLLNWMPTLLVGKGFARSEAILISLGFSIGGALGAVVLGTLLARIGKMVLFVIIYAAMAVSLAVLASLGTNLALMLAASTLVGVFVIGAQYLLYGLAPTYYPVAVRGTGVGSAIAVGRLGAVLGPWTAGQILAFGYGSSAVIFALVPIIALALVAALAMVAAEHRLRAGDLGVAGVAA